MEHLIRRGKRIDSVVAFGLDEDFWGERDYKSSLVVGKVLEEGEREVMMGDPKAHTFVGIAVDFGRYDRLLLLRQKMEVAYDDHPEVLKVARRGVSEVERLAAVGMGRVTLVKGLEVAAHLPPIANANFLFGVGFGGGE